MTKNAVSDKRIVIGLLIGCVIAILIFTFGWWKIFIHNLSNPVFSIGIGILLGACVVEGIGVYRCMDDDRKDGKRKVLLLFTVLLCGWLGGWAVGSNEKKMFEDDVNKAKAESLYSDTNHMPAKIPQ